MHNNLHLHDIRAL